MYTGSLISIGDLEAPIRNVRGIDGAFKGKEVGIGQVMRNPRVRVLGR